MLHLKLLLLCAGTIQGQCCVLSKCRWHAAEWKDHASTTPCSLIQWLGVQMAREGGCESQTSRIMGGRKAAELG